MKIFNKRAALRTLQVLRSRGFLPFFKNVINLLVGERPIQGFDEVQAYFHGKKCLEIGGPSFIFQTKSILPIYREAKSVDNCNFSSKTVWEGKISEGLTFNPTRNKLGRQFIDEATNLKGIKNASYDCVISSQVLEHVANPLAAFSNGTEY